MALPRLKTDMPKEVFPSNWEGEEEHAMNHIATNALLVVFVFVTFALTSVKRIGFFPSALGKNPSFSSPASGSSNLTRKCTMTVNLLRLRQPLKTLHIGCRQSSKSHACFFYYYYYYMYIWKTNVWKTDPPQRAPQTYLTVWVPFLYKDPSVEASKNTTKHAFKKREDYAGSESYSISLITFTILVIINGKLSWQRQKTCSHTCWKKKSQKTWFEESKRRFSHKYYKYRNTKRLSANSSGHVLC